MGTAVTGLAVNRGQVRPGALRALRHPVGVHIGPADEVLQVGERPDAVVDDHARRGELVSVGDSQVVDVTPLGLGVEPNHTYGNRSRAACGTCPAETHCRRWGRRRFRGISARGRD